MSHLTQNYLSRVTDFQPLATRLSQRQATLPSDTVLLSNEIRYAEQALRALLYSDHLPHDWEKRLDDLRYTIKILRESYDSVTAKITMREVSKWL